MGKTFVQGMRVLTKWGVSATDSPMSDNIFFSIISSVGASAIVTTYLNHRNNKQLERIKTNLAAELAERNFRYSLYYKEMSSAVFIIHKSVIAAQGAIYDVIDNRMTSRMIETYVQTAGDRFKEFMDAHLNNRLFLTKECDTKLFQVQALFSDLLNIIKTDINTAADILHEANYKANRLGRLNGISESYKQIFLSLQNDFKELLGFNNKTPV